YLETTGVSVLPPNHVFFNNRTGILMVRATAEALDRVQKAIDALSAGSSKETGQGFPTGSPGGTERSAASSEPRNSPGAEAFGGFDNFAFKPADETPSPADSKDRAESEKPKPANSSAALETRIFTLDPKTF